MNDIELAGLSAMLEKIGIIDFQYRKSKRKDSFNIFNLFPRKFDEVHLHSRFLFELLNPFGSHACDSKFLSEFFDHLGIKDFDFRSIRIRKEYRNIDLLITNDKQAIVIENKLWADDQPGQLQRYYEYLVNEGFKDIRILYLSIDGKDPQDFSIGDLRQLNDFGQVFQVLSYREDIDGWLEKCIKEVYDLPKLRETLVQYRLLIQDISGKTMGEEEKNEILELLSKGDNVIKAKKIAENWNHVKWHAEWNFWVSLESIVEKNYEILELQKYNGAKVTSNIHASRNRNPWFGLMFKIGELGGDDACLFIERGTEDVYYGLTMIRNNSKDFNKEAKFDNIAELIEEFSEWKRANHWMGGKYCEPRINFNKFSGDDTLKLFNESFRIAYISKLWTDIQLYIDQLSLALDSANKNLLNSSRLTTDSD